MKVNISDYKEGSKQDISVVIDDYDLYSADCTLSEIIHPLLIKFKDKMNSHPTRIEDESIPSGIKSDEDKWDWILGEMIYAHHYSLNKFDAKNFKGVDKRAENGMRLFGVFYSNLWT